jgi:hypothetical protein
MTVTIEAASEAAEEPQIETRHTIDILAEVPRLQLFNSSTLQLFNSSRLAKT